MNNRKPQFAGSFYPSSDNEIQVLLSKIKKQEEGAIAYNLSCENIIGGVVPHAGYIYSAYQAIHFYEIIAKSTQDIDTFVVINPNHRGYGNGKFNLCGFNTWETPLGKIDVDVEFANLLGIEVNDAAHKFEHSGEVQLPLMQFSIKRAFQIVMITMNDQTPETAKLLAQKIYDAEQKTGRKISVIASSDFSHYVDPDKGSRVDQFLIDAVLKLNTYEAFDAVKTHQITACGYGPIMTLMEYSKLKSPNSTAKVLRRGHSGEIIPSKSVVDYVSMLFYSTNTF